MHVICNNIRCFISLKKNIYPTPHKNHLINQLEPASSNYIYADIFKIKYCLGKFTREGEEFFFCYQMMRKSCIITKKRERNYELSSIPFVFG